MPTACISHCWQRVCVGWFTWLPRGNSTTKRFGSATAHTRGRWEQQRMKHILGYILFLIPVSVFSQTELDYQLYSKVIDETIDKWDFDRDTISKVILIEKFVPYENYGHGFKESLYDSPIDMVHWFVGYDSSRLNLINQKDVKKSIIQLDSIFMNTPTLSPSMFNLKTPVEAIPQRRFDSLFKGLFKRNFDKGWAKFYKKYPSTFGIYELSRVSYSGKYACFYVAHRAKPLFGSGTMFILKEENNSWEILAQFNLWNN
jgi:hypothetical protein